MAQLYVEYLDMDNRLWEVENGIEQADENGDILRASEDFLEHEVDRRLDSQWHRWLQYC